MQIVYGLPNDAPMTSYFQFSKRASWTLLIVTLLLAGFIFFTIGFVSGILALVQRLMVPDEHPWRFDRALWIAVAVMLPALGLARFYFVRATRMPSSRYSTLGWMVSSVYHAALTCLLTFWMPGTVEVSGIPIRWPLSFFSGAAFFVSLLLLIRYPRPPRLPLPHPMEIRSR